ncbi:MAG: hypothetical protein ACRC44_00525 [Bifidobacterium asteroides]
MLKVLDLTQNRYYFITDENLNDLLVTNRLGYLPWTYSNMEFVSFFRVPSVGLAVAGR